MPYLFLVAFGVLMSFAGCSRAVSLKNTQAQLCPVPTVTLNVTNNKWTAVALYVVHGSSRDRLGLVPSVQSATYPIPPGLLGPDGQIFVEVDAVGAPDVYRTPSIMVLSTRTIIDLTVENFIAYSTVFVSSEDEP